MPGFLEHSRELVGIALLALASLLTLGLLGLMLWRCVDELRFLRRQRLMARYRGAIDALLTPGNGDEPLRILLAVPPQHRPILADLMFSALRLTTGELIPRVRRAAAALGLVDKWVTSLEDRRWWVRAEAVVALGLVRDPNHVGQLLAGMDDEHEEVRAAAIDALGRIGDSACGPALLARLRDQSRHQRTRLVEAIRALGPSMVPMLLAHAQEHPDDAAMAIDVLAVSGATAAIPHLLEWSSAADVQVRRAALRALGSIGLDDRSVFYALRALDDIDGGVRAMAARALGRSGKTLAVPYLAAHLDDEWLVAAHCATGLRRLGRTGASALEKRAAAADGQGADLARQMLWELQFLKVGA